METPAPTLFTFDWSFIWTILNLLILYVILRKLLFKRITAFMDKRSEGIAQDISSAEQSRFEAAAMKERYETMMQTAETKAVAILAAAKVKADEETQKILKDARRDAENIIEHANAEADTQKKGIVKAARDQIIDIALSLSTKILKKNLNDQTNAEYIKKLFEEEGAA